MAFRDLIRDVTKLSGPVAILLFAVSCFFAMAGAHVLDPSHIDWLGAGDQRTHYLGWELFRRSPWSFPLGANPCYGLEISSSILYSDSIPLLAFLLKPFQAALPEPFQYLGIWTLLCFVLQGLFAWKLMGLLTAHPMVRFFGAAIFVVAPPFLIRIGGHFALSGHWILLAAIYLVLKPLGDERIHGALWATLCAIAALVHAYLLAMVLALWLSDVLTRWFLSPNRWPWLILEGGLVGATALLCLWQAGLFTVAADSFQTGVWGRGRMPLLSPINPGGWSRVLPNLSPGGHEGLNAYEGFNFFGLGALSLLATAALVAIKRPRLLVLPRRFIALLLVLLGFTAFAVTNRVVVGPFEVVVEVPQKALDVATMFRASGRFFWPVFYTLLIAGIAILVRGLGPPRHAALVLAAGLALQVADTSPGWTTRSNRAFSKEPQWVSPLVASFWQSVPERYAKIRLIMPGNRQRNWLPFAHFSAQNGMCTDAIYSARVDAAKVKQAREKARSAILTGSYEPDTLYVLDKEFVRRALVNLRANDVLAEVDGFHVIAPGWARCSTCPILPPEVSINHLLPQIRLGETVSFDRASNGKRFLGKGWSHPEAWGIWSVGHSAEIILPAPVVDIEGIQIMMQARASLPAGGQAQRVGVRINGVAAGVLEFQRREGGTRLVDIPSGVCERGKACALRVVFEIDAPTRPIDVGTGRDGRQLGIGLRSLTVVPKQDGPPAP